MIAGRDGQRPGAIVVHTTEGTFEGTVTWFDRPDSGVSAHYLVGLDGRVGAFVDEGDAARHVGGAAKQGDDPNLWTIGMEFEDGGEPNSERSDELYRVGARLIAEVAGRWQMPIDDRHVLPHHELDPRKTCPGRLDLPRLIREARAERPLLVSLLPVRNGEEDLPGYLESVSAFADAVVALDDGSTDRTREILEGHPLVKILLTNPRRLTYAGWDDAANRDELLGAARRLDPDWVLFLDVDERIEDDDGRALREFVRTDAIPSCAYGLELYRAWQGRHEATPRTVFRLFASEPGQEVPDEELHFEPVPTNIPRQSWIRTSIRVRHLAAETGERIAARLAKYEEIDPAGEYPTRSAGSISHRPASS